MRRSIVERIRAINHDRHPSSTAVHHRQAVDRPKRAGDARNSSKRAVFIIRFLNVLKFDRFLIVGEDWRWSIASGGHLFFSTR